jgi:hypothetical protein
MMTYDATLTLKREFACLTGIIRLQEQEVQEHGEYPRKQEDEQNGGKERLRNNFNWRRKKVTRMILCVVATTRSCKLKTLYRASFSTV